MSGRLILLARLARPHFLLAGLGLYGLGAAYAVARGAPFEPTPVILGCLAVLFAQASLSYSNDYFDAEADRFTEPGLFSGGSGVLVKHPELRALAIRIAASLTAASLVLGIVTWVAYRYPAGILALLVAGNLLAWFYAAPPLRLAYRGLGELATAFTAGVLLPEMGVLVARRSLLPSDLIWLPPLLAYGFCFILSVEIPDIEADRRAKKRTLPARVGRGPAFVAIAACSLVATTWFVSQPRAFSPLDARVLGAASLIPLAAATFAALRRPEAGGPATQLANSIVVAVAAFFTLTDAYLVILAAR
jgi:1,4-dihydroxy-2-naphthoate octaprenyltransferase